MLGKKHHCHQNIGKELFHPTAVTSKAPFGKPQVASVTLTSFEVRTTGSANS